MKPLGEYYLWCDHRAKGEAAEITAAAHRENLEAIQWCGGVYSSEWGFSKLLHWLRHNPSQRSEFACAFEHCDMVAATLCGITDPKKVKRSICAAGPQMALEPESGRSAARAVSGQGRSVCWPAFATNWMANIRPPTRLPARSQHTGPSNLDSSLAYRFP